MKTTILTCAAVVLGVVLAAPDAHAQLTETPERSGTAAAEYLLLPVTAQGAALSSAYTGGMDNIMGLEGLTVNPAALMSNLGTSAMFSRTEYVADVGTNHFGVAQAFGNNNVALTLTSWDYGDIEVTTVDDPENLANLTYSASNLVLGASVARQFTDRMSAGVTSKVIYEEIDDMSASTIAFDAGMTYAVGESGLRFGISLRNFGPAMAYGGNGLDQDIPIVGSSDGIAGGIATADAELPSLLNIGASYTREFAGDVSFTGLATFRSNAYDADEYALAGQLGYADLVMVRGGYQFRNDMDQTFYQGWNVGGGLNYQAGTTRISVDYAYRGTDYFDGVNLFTVGVGF